MSRRGVIGEGIKLLEKLHDYKYERAYPSYSSESWQGMAEQVQNLIEKLYEYEDYKRKIEYGEKRKVQLSNVAVLNRGGEIWKSDDVPVGMETEAIVRLINSSEAREKRDFYMLPVYIPVAELRIPEDITAKDVAGSSISFRKVNQISYRR